MATTAPWQPTASPVWRRVPARFAAPWQPILHLVLGAAFGLIGALLLACLVLAVRWSAGLTIPNLVLATLAVLATIAATLIVLLLLLLLISPTLSSWQRSRYAAMWGVTILPPPQPEVTEDAIRWIVRQIRLASTWRQFTYHLFAGVFAPCAAVLVIALMSGGLALALSPLFTIGWGRFVPGVFGMAAGGLLLLLLTPWVARTLAGWDLAVARRLLGVPLHEELARQVAALSASREGVVDAADAERRRIERNLHDGAQQRLTSLALNLGIARATLTDLPEAGRKTIEQAHEEAKQALADLRNLVRGLHPAVLEDRGLDAALSGIAARSPVPVRLDVRLTERVNPTVEAVAYFVISEAINNAVTHAEASHINVTVKRVGNRLRVTVLDDGRGGADAQRGSGLRGLAQRVASVDGTLHLHSPPGGPTLIQVELPCGS